MTDRRAFLQAIALGALLPPGVPAGAPRTPGRPAAAIPLRSERTTGGRTSMYLAYTSFAVRMLQGRDILKSTAAALDAHAFLQLCRRFHVGGGAGRPLAAAGRQPGGARRRPRRIRAAAHRHRALRSVPLSRVARGIRAGCGRGAVARRDAGPRGAAVWTALRELRDARRRGMRSSRNGATRSRACGRSSIAILSRSASRTTRTGSRRSWSRCSGKSTARTSARASISATTSLCSRIPTRRSQVLAPYAVTTHLKDMAVRRTERLRAVGGAARAGRCCRSTGTLRRCGRHARRRRCASR